MVLRFQFLILYESRSKEEVDELFLDQIFFQLWFNFLINKYNLKINF